MCVVSSSGADPHSLSVRPRGGRATGRQAQMSGLQPLHAESHWLGFMPPTVGTTLQSPPPSSAFARFPPTVLTSVVLPALSSPTNTMVISCGSGASRFATTHAKFLLKVNMSVNSTGDTQEVRKTTRTLHVPVPENSKINWYRK